MNPLTRNTLIAKVHDNFTNYSMLHKLFLYVITGTNCCMIAACQLLLTTIGKIPASPTAMAAKSYVVGHNNIK